MSLLWKLRWNWLKIKDQRSRRRAQAESRESMSESSRSKECKWRSTPVLFCSVPSLSQQLLYQRPHHGITLPCQITLPTSSSTSPWLCATDETTLIYYLDAIAFCCGILVKQNHLYSGFWLSNLHNISDLFTIHFNWGYFKDDGGYGFL